MAGADWTDKRPMSPHIQVWRWHATMAASIFHRATGAALYFGSFLIALWIISLGMRPEAGTGAPALYTAIDGIISSIPGQIVMVLWAAAVLFHWANGVRYLVWSGPRAGFDPKTASAVSVFNFAFAILGALAIWAGATFI